MRKSQIQRIATMKERFELCSIRIWKIANYACQSTNIVLFFNRRKKINKDQPNMTAIICVTLRRNEDFGWLTRWFKIWSVLLKSPCMTFLLYLAFGAVAENVSDEIFLQLFETFATRMLVEFFLNLLGDFINNFMNWWFLGRHAQKWHFLWVSNALLQEI